MEGDIPKHRASVIRGKHTPLALKQIRDTWMGWEFSKESSENALAMSMVTNWFQTFLFKRTCSQILRESHETPANFAKSEDVNTSKQASKKSCDTEKRNTSEHTIQGKGGQLQDTQPTWQILHSATDRPTSAW